MLCCIQKYVEITEEGVTYIHICFDGENVSFNVQFVWNNNNNNNNKCYVEAKGSTGDTDSNIIYWNNSKVTITKSNKT